MLIVRSILQGAESSGLGRRAMLYCCAVRFSVAPILTPMLLRVDHYRNDVLEVRIQAVSDFFVPAAEMTQHKIQSAGAALVLTLPGTPKVLKQVTKINFCVVPSSSNHTRTCFSSAICTYVSNTGAA